MPLLTLKGIVDFLLDRGIKLKSMNLHCITDLDGILIIHCHMDKDKIRYTAHLLEKMMGVTEVEFLEGKISNLIKGQRMQNEILQEIRELRQLVLKITGLDNEKMENQFSEEALNKAQKLYLNMSIQRGDWVKDDDIWHYIKSLPWNPGAFIRKEFEFTNWIKRGHEYLYAKKDLIALSEELNKRNIDCKRYKEFLDDKAAFDKRMAILEEAKTKNIPSWKIQKGLKNITTTEAPKPDPEKVRAHLTELKQDFRKNKFELYIDIYKGTHAQMKAVYYYEKYIDPGIKSGCRRWINDFNYANHAMELITGKKEKFKVENNGEGIQL